VHLLEETLILLAASVAIVALFRRLRLPPILGYLFVGLIVGPGSLGLISDPEDVRVLAEFGVVFLLFTIGLEFSIPQLIAMRGSVLGVGGAQVLICSVAFAFAAWALGSEPGQAVVIGGALALSSTAIVTKQLAEQLAIHTRHGRRSVGILLFQDLAVVPLLIVIPLFAGQGDGDGFALALTTALAKGVAVFTILVLLGRGLLRPLFREVAHGRSNELFTLAVLLVALMAAWATHLADLSLALGAFLAGIMLGETEFRHQIEADIRPFRDVLLGLFFITVGMVVDPSVLASNWAAILGVAAGMIAVKALTVYVLVRIAGEDSPVAIRTALIIAQGGEFGFAAMSLALSSALIDDRIGQIVIAAIVVSMALAPFCINYCDRVAQRAARSDRDTSRRGAVAAVRNEVDGSRDHVIVCGYGRTGQDIIRFLASEDIPYQALDLDPVRLNEAQAAGEAVNYGDATRPEILAAAGVDRARLVAITFTNPGETVRALHHIREIAPDTPVVVRTRDDAWMERLEQAGATVVVPEVLEASLMLASQTLALLGLPMSRVFRYVRDVRADRYRLFRGYFHGQAARDLEQADRMREQLRAVTLPAGAHGVGRPLGEIGLDEMGIEVQAIRRGGHRGPAPEPDVILIEDDILVLFGAPEDLEKANEALLSGH
jgi:CPA2 family monovalent cation:H+ antiporter-2